MILVGGFDADVDVDLGAWSYSCMDHCGLTNDSHWLMHIQNIGGTRIHAQKSVVLVLPGTVEDHFRYMDGAVARSLYVVFRNVDRCLGWVYHKIDQSYAVDCVVDLCCAGFDCIGGFDGYLDPGMSRLGYGNDWLSFDRADKDFVVQNQNRVHEGFRFVNTRIHY